MLHGLARPMGAFCRFLGIHTLMMSVNEGGLMSSFQSVRRVFLPATLHWFRVPGSYSTGVVRGDRLLVSSGGRQAALSHPVLPVS